MSDLKIGDIVTLKSGGPRMVVDLVPEGEESTHAFCMWMSASNELQEGEFRQAVLVKAPEPGTFTWVKEK